jgi:hypothetical protein
VDGASPYKALSTITRRQWLLQGELEARLRPSSTLKPPGICSHMDWTLILRLSYPSRVESSDRHAGDNSQIRHHRPMPRKHGLALDSVRNCFWDGQNRGGVRLCPPSLVSLSGQGIVTFEPSAAPSLFWAGAISVRPFAVVSLQ